MPDTHPSFYALDRFAHGVGREEVGSHVVECTRCRDYVEMKAPPLPRWASEMSKGKMARWNRWVWPTLVPAFGIATLLLVALPLSESTISDTTAKGEPGITVFVRRDAKIEPWKPGSAIAAGDEIRLRVAASGFRVVRVYSVSSRDKTLLYEGDLPEGVHDLPAAWRVDGNSNEEVLEVIFETDGKGGGHQAQRRIVLPKRTTSYE